MINVYNKVKVRTGGEGHVTLTTPGGLSITLLPGGGVVVGDGKTQTIYHPSWDTDGQIQLTMHSPCNLLVL